jgi:hypothetical protein
VKVYYKNREKTTLILLAFFLVYTIERVHSGLGEPRIIITSWVVEIAIGIIIAATALLIPIAIMKIRELYIFPPLVGIALIAVNAISSFSRNTIVQLANIIFYLLGYDIWYPLFDLMNSVYIRNEYLAPVLNPVSAYLIPDVSYLYLLILGLLLALPTIILFAIIAWREKDGKALGFVLGLIIIFTGGALSGSHALVYVAFEIAGISIIGAGITGLIDKYVYKKTLT